MNSCDEFYARRDQRTQTYLHGVSLLPHPIAVFWTEEAVTTPVGQVLMLSLANQLARFCRSATFSGQDVPLVTAAPQGGTTLHDAVLTACHCIDPCGSWSVGEAEGAAYRICIGRGNGDADLFVGSDGWIAHAAPTAAVVPPVDTQANPLGAGLASCLATANAFKASFHLAQPAFHGALSLWNFGRDDHAGQGPTLHAMELGDVLMLGAGAVAAALTYWLRFLPITAHWDILDRDSVQLDNTNRGLLFTAADAGWFGTAARGKASVLADFLPHATPHELWFDEYQTHGRRWDLILPLANEHGVRAAVQAMYPPLLIHATTSANWQTQLHRHRPAQDRCIVCRLPERNLPPPSCAIGALGPAQPDAHQPDAALPFLSAGAGLLVAADLLRLGHTDFATERGNLITLDWFGDLGRPTIRHETCEPACRYWGEPETRQLLNSSTRWFALDDGRRAARRAESSENKTLR